MAIVPKYDFFGSFNGKTIFENIARINDWEGEKALLKVDDRVAGCDIDGGVAAVVRCPCSHDGWQGQAASLPRDGVSIRPDLGSTTTTITTTIFPTHHQSAANTGTSVICPDCRGASAFNLLWFCHLMPVVWRGLKLDLSSNISLICTQHFSLS